MDIDIFKGFILLLLLIISFFYWNKSKDKGWLWFTWIGIVTFLLKLIDILIKYYYSVSAQFKFTFDIVSIILNSIIVALIILVLWKWFKK